MNIDEKLIAYLEDLSCLNLCNAEKNRVAEEMKKILNGMECLEDLNTEGVAERSQPFDNTNAFRDDVVCVSFERELILKNASNKTDDMFIAPKTVE